MIVTRVPDGHVWLRIEPQPRGSGYEFVNGIVGGVVPKEFIPAVDRGVQEQMENGVVAGFAMVDCKVTLYDDIPRISVNNESAITFWDEVPH